MTGPENALEFLKDYREKGGNPIREYREVKKYWDFKAREKGVPVAGLFELTPLCNFNCKMCYMHLDEDQLNGQKILPVETWKQLMYEAWQAGMMFATLTGGECLAYPGFEELFLYLHSLGVEVDIVTNGFLLDEKWIQFFNKHQPAVIQITLYGWNDDVYERVTGKRAFTTVAHNIKRAVEEGLPVFLALTPNRYLGEDLLETIRVAAELCDHYEINSYLTVPREETGRSGQRDDVDLDLYIRAYKFSNQLKGLTLREIKEEDLPPYGGPCHETSAYGLVCGAGRSYFAFNWKGIMLPCLELSTICEYPLKEGFAAAWVKMNQVVNRWPRVPECEGCAYKDACLNCAANMLPFADPGKMPVGLCERTRELVRQGIKQIPDCE